MLEAGPAGAGCSGPGPSWVLEVSKDPNLMTCSSAQPPLRDTMGGFQLRDTKFAALRAMGNKGSYNSEG